MLQLYSSENCPYCRVVESFLDEQKVPYEMFNVATDARSREALIERAGRLQVPFLIDTENGVEMYESSDIIRYVQRSYLEKVAG